MPRTKRSLAEIVKRLAEHYGEPVPPLARTALEFILFENVSYLVSEARQAAAFLRLRHEIGTTADSIALASDAKLRSVVDAPASIRENKFEALRVIAHTVRDEFNNNLEEVLDWPVDRALKALQQFPSVGLPGAERILLLMGRAPILSLDSNGLRVLNRLGYAPELKDYNKNYRAVRAAIANEISNDIAEVQRTHLLLRLHGKQLCKRTGPRCDECPLFTICDPDFTPPR